MVTVCFTFCWRVYCGKICWWTNVAVRNTTRNVVWSLGRCQSFLYTEEFASVNVFAFIYRVWQIIPVTLDVIWHLYIGVHLWSFGFAIRHWVFECGSNSVERLVNLALVNNLCCRFSAGVVQQRDVNSALSGYQMQRLFTLDWLTEVNELTTICFNPPSEDDGCCKSISSTVEHRYAAYVSRFHIRSSNNLLLVTDDLK